MSYGFPRRTSSLRKARPPPALISRPQSTSAQRRPESKPRRHPAPPVRAAVGRLRSTKAGVETPATPVAGAVAVAVAVAVARSTKAGVETPATRQVPLTYSCSAYFAQRRPESKPQRHERVEALFERVGVRSTKAGVETPATLLIMASCDPLRAIASQFDHRTAERVAEQPRSAG